MIKIIPSILITISIIASVGCEQSSNTASEAASKTAIAEQKAKALDDEESGASKISVESLTQHIVTLHKISRR